MKYYISLLLLLLLSVAFYACENNATDTDVPVLSPKESMKKIKLQDDNLTIKLVASEPLVSTPIAMNFDDKGRIWVVEMTDYKPIKEDSSQKYPMGDIAILEDTDGDGVMDKRKVFLDSIAFPRALCLVDSGVLVSIPPNLWYYKIDNDKPGKRVLVDSAYTVSYNIEGQTNGLFRGMDNWIYSVGFGSSKRYRRINGKWITQKTFLRGQWGITQDNYGHLFYNNNSQNLLGDYFLPGVTHGNKYLKKTAGFNNKIVSDNRVYPLIPTPGVNRGYREGVLDSSGRLLHFTAACGPLIYRGGLLPQEFEENAFVCEPAAYLIKRDIIQRDGIEITGKQALEGKEFLASADERFRPVSLQNGPDGALYIVDMYRGVIQDDLSLTDYLKKYSLKHGLNQPVGCGRIYKIVPKEAELHQEMIPDNPEKLITLLSNKNGWLRDHAQQKMVDNQYKELVPMLRNLLSNADNDITKIHALWTLEGLNALSQQDIIRLFHSGDSHLQSQALTALISVLNQQNYRDYISFINESVTHSDALTAPYLAYVAGKVYPFSSVDAISVWEKLIKTYSENKYVIDAIISSIQGKEELFKNKFKSSGLFHKRLNQALKAKDHPEDKRKLAELKKKYEAGYAIFEGFCQTCHGSDGNGTDYVAPPLNGSEWVNGDKNRLIPILLYGLTGPVKVKGKIYKKPTITGDMPGIKDKYPDEEIAELLSFIRQAWSNNAEEVTTEDILGIKKKYKDREHSFTAEELLAIDSVKSN